ncbi:MAG: hypothetical protein QOJ81_37 [Chloroflexota bacterium]|jgi:hypothetical protein|nr:hypothetical protein [Chloroflexota bacterium]
MNDDMLAAELRRRADAAHVAPDWPRRVMLPAVREEIETRPQRVPSSSWVPRLGVAALVTALLVLVVALPRLGPQPPAASPTPADDGVLSTSEFAGLVAHGQLRGQTVLVQGRITVGDVFSRANTCTPPTGTCSLGVLEGAQPPLGVEARYTPTTEAPGSGSWEALDGGRDYHFPTPPIDGVLALRVLGEAEVEFVGLVHETATGDDWTVADASDLDPTTLGPDAAVLVRGYLVDTSRPGQFVDIDCTFNPHPVIPGLPNRYCKNTDFLSSLSPNTDFGPNPDRLRVQVGAADRFASNFQGREALYAISPRLYGGCDDGSPPPCWLWDTVARIDSPPFPSPPPAPSPTSAPISRELDCQLLAPKVIDETGLVTDCGASQNPGDSIPFAISNPEGDVALLEISYSSVPACDGPDILTLTGSATGYDLVARYTRAIRLCDGVVFETHIFLQVAHSIHADQVVVRHEREIHATSPSPAPTSSGVTFECPPTGRADNASLHPTIVDYTGLVVGCEVPQKSTFASHDSDVFRFGNPGNRMTELQIEWGSDPCGAAIEITLRESGNGIAVEGRSTYEGDYCILPLVLHMIRLELGAPIDASAVTFHWQ